MSTLDDLGGFLATNSLGTVGKEIWLGRFPDTPDNTITLIEFPGIAPVMLQGAVGAENPNIQIQCRGTDYAETRSRCQQVWTLLATVANIIIGSTRYQQLRCHASPALIGHDSQNRTIIGFNLAVMKEVSA